MCCALAERWDDVRLDDFMADDETEDARSSAALADVVRRDDDLFDANSASRALGVTGR